MFTIHRTPLASGVEDDTTEDDVDDTAIGIDSD
jgi:hypothetical protein